MSFIDSQQFSPIQSVQSGTSNLVLIDEVQMLKQQPLKQSFGLQSLKRLIDVQRKVSKIKKEPVP